MMLRQLASRRIALRCVLWLAAVTLLQVGAPSGLSQSRDSRAEDPSRAFLIPVQSGRSSNLVAGKFLVADRELSDPNFIETVILITNHTQQSTMGLIINRRTKFPLSRVFPDLKSTKGRSEPIYIGGPVERGGGFGLLRSHTKPKEAQHIFADVYLVSTKALLEKTLEAGAKPDVFRVYVGYAGWGAGQLENEVELGAWHVVRADADVVFDADPGSVWSRLIDRTELRIARR